MPPKKKGKKGGKKKEKSEGKGERGEKEEAEPEITVLDKQYYLSQIQSLERVVDRVTQRCEQLANAEEHAREQYRNLHQEKIEIVSFLKERLKGREDEIEELKTRLMGLIQSSQQENEAYEGKLQSLQQEFNRTKGDLSDQILSLTRKLESLEEFRIQKEKLDAEHQALEALLKKEREQNREKVALLERTAIEEKQALIKEQSEKLIVLTESLREEARLEIHSTTRGAINQSESQFKTISTLKSKILKIRQENVELRNNLRELISREAVLQDSLDHMSTISERRAMALRKVMQKALEHAGVSKEYNKLLEEKESMRRNLQQTQVQLDAATKISCDIRENSAEKSVALELLSTKLQEERFERKKITEVLHSALQLLQESIFSKAKEKPAEDSDKKNLQNSTLKQLIDILSEGAEFARNFNGAENVEPSYTDTTERKDIITKPLATYTAGDLGLIPKSKNRK